MIDENKIRAQTKNNPDTVFVLSGDNGKVVYCNPAASTLTGLTVHELLTLNIVDIFKVVKIYSFFETSRLLHNYKNRITGKPAPLRYTTTVVVKDGRVAPVEICGQKITWHDQPADLITVKDLSVRQIKVKSTQTGVKAAENRSGEPESPAMTTRNLRVFCLGALNVYNASQQVYRWRNLRARSVFECLIARRNIPVSKDILMETLWPSFDAEAAANNLKAAIHAIRQILTTMLSERREFDPIYCTHGGYMINPDIDMTIDVDEFENLWTQGRSLEKEGNIAGARLAYEKAASIYQGDYLEDEPYEEWTLERREEIKSIYLLILNKLAENAFSNGDYEGCIAYCHKLIAKDETHLESYRKLMCCYNRLGQRNFALHYYNNYLQNVQSELGTGPDVILSDFYQQLIAGKSI
jgi:PAS domain S-box-containing protein